MRNIRIYFKKLGRMKFVSHLDMTRVMSRLIKKSGIPVWYTEGFNRHIYINFALPLSLGFESNCEFMDIRLNDEEFSNSATLTSLQNVCPPDIDFFAVEEPSKPTKEIGFACYELCLDEFNDDTKNALEAFLNSESVICEKVGKKGKVKEIDLIPKIKEYKIDSDTITLVLVAGSEDNLNPTLVMDTFFERTATDKIYYTVLRTAILDKQGNDFKQQKPERK